MKFIKFAHLLQQKLRMRAATGGQVLVSALTVALSIFSTQNAEAYDWVTNVAGIGPTVTIDVNNIPTTDKDLKLGLAPLDNAEDADKVVYLYEVHARLFVNATGHDGTGIGLLDVGAPFAFRKNNNTLDILTNFINDPGKEEYTNKLQYNLARHGNSLFMDRSSDDGSDMIQTWSFTDANDKRGADKSQVNDYFYLKGSPHKDIDSRGVTYKTSDEYYVVLKNFDGSNIQSVIDDKHSPFDIAKADGNGVPENAAVFILVTRQMLLSAFDKAAQYASKSNNIDATWLMKDEDFYRTNADHLLTNKDRAWKLQGGLKDLDNTFWPIGGTGASSNQYIGIGETDAWTDYNRYFVTKLPYNKTGALTQTVTLPKAGWYSFSVKGIGGSGDCLFAHIVNKTYPEGTLPTNITSTAQYAIEPLKVNNFYDNEESEAGKLNYRYDKERDMAYFSTVDGVKYFYKVIEGEDKDKVTGDGLDYGYDKDLHNSLNIADIDDNGNITKNNSYVKIGKGKTASFTVNVPEEGYYILSYYLQGGTANISTNGQTKEIKNNNEKGQAALEFYLKGGDNTFTINTTEGTISLDRIIVERGRLLYAENHKLKPSFNDAQNALADNDIYTIQPGNYSVNEDGTTLNDIKIGPANNIDNSLTTIKNLGIGTTHAIGKKDGNNTIDLAYIKKNNYTDNELNLDISSLNLPKGNYRITVYAYNYGQDREVWVGICNPNQANYKPWYKYITFEVNANDNKNILSFKGNTETLQSQYFDTDLENQKYISFGCGNGWAPDIAYITIQRNQEPDYTNKITQRPEFKFEKGQTKTFTVDDAKNGSYRLSLWYSSVYPTNISIKVNGTERNLTLDPSSKNGGENAIYENEIISAFTFIPLQDGSNFIEITNNENDIALENIEINPGINAEVELGRIFSKADEDKSVEVSIYVPENNAKVEFGVYKSNTEEPVIIDHFRASYLGDIKGLLLQDSQDDWVYAGEGSTTDKDKTKYQWSQCQEQNNQNNQDDKEESKTGELNNVPVYLVRDFGAGKNGDNTGMWSTIALPFNMNRSQLYEAFGETVQVGYLGPSTGTTLYFHLYDLSNGSEWADDNKYVIEAGKPYFIKVTKTANTMSSNAELNALVSSEGDIESGGLGNKLLGIPEGASDEDIKSKNIKYYVLHVNIGNQSSKTFEEDENTAADPENLIYIKTDAYITDGKGVEYSVEGHDGNSLKFVPVLYRTQIPNGVYTLSDGRFKFYTGGTQCLKGFRAYIEDSAPGYGPNSSSSSSTTAKPWYFENSTTGIVQIIENIGEDDVKNLSPTDKVYNLNGQQVNANELHRGIYIRNGRKFIVK